MIDSNGTHSQILTPQVLNTRPPIHQQHSLIRKQEENADGVGRCKVSNHPWEVRFKARPRGKSYDQCKFVCLVV